MRLGTVTKRVPAARRTPTLLELAWAAGIYEGEGTCTPTRSACSISQVDLWLLHRLQEMFGGTIECNRKFNPAKPNERPCSRWRLAGARARGFLLTIYSFLSPRRQAAIQLLLQGAP